MRRSPVQVLERPQNAKAPKQDVMRQDESDEGMEQDIEEVEDDESKKDDAEMELERLIFGDSAGFRDGLKGSALAAQEDEDEDGAGLDGLDDADVGQALGSRYHARLVC